MLEKLDKITLKKTSKKLKGGLLPGEAKINVKIPKIYYNFRELERVNSNKNKTKFIQSFEFFRELSNINKIKNAAKDTISIEIVIHKTADDRYFLMRGYTKLIDKTSLENFVIDISKLFPFNIKSIIEQLKSKTFRWTDLIQALEAKNREFNPYEMYLNIIEGWREKVEYLKGVMLAEEQSKKEQENLMKKKFEPIIKIREYFVKLFELKDRFQYNIELKHCDTIDPKSIDELYIKLNEINDRLSNQNKNKKFYLKVNEHFGNNNNYFYFDNWDLLYKFLIFNINKLQEEYSKLLQSVNNNNKHLYDQPFEYEYRAIFIFSIYFDEPIKNKRKNNADPFILGRPNSQRVIFGGLPKKSVKTRSRSK